MLLHLVSTVQMSELSNESPALGRTEGTWSGQLEEGLIRAEEEAFTKKGS